MLRHSLIAAAVLAVTAIAAPAQAAPIQGGGVTRQEVADWLSRKGVPAKIESLDSGERIVAAETNGVKFDVYFYACKGERCASVQFAAGWSGAENVSLDEVNSFMKDTRYARVYKSGPGELWVEYDTLVGPGASWELLDEHFVLVGAIFTKVTTTLDL